MTTIIDQLAEVRREVAMRERAYPGFIARGSLKIEAAERQKERLIAAQATLNTLAGVQKQVEQAMMLLAQSLKEMIESSCVPHEIDGEFYVDPETMDRAVAPRVEQYTVVVAALGDLLLKLGRPLPDFPRARPVPKQATTW
jgi:antibiotic biosynthesis monooxygenase (ABM) superfamily enzyme